MLPGRGRGGVRCVKVCPKEKGDTYILFDGLHIIRADIL